MRKIKFLKKVILLTTLYLIYSARIFAQATNSAVFSFHFTSAFLLMHFLLLITLVILLTTIYLKNKIKAINEIIKERRIIINSDTVIKYINTLNSKEIAYYLKANQVHHTQKPSEKNTRTFLFAIIILMVSLFTSGSVFAQAKELNSKSVFGESGLIITFILIFIPILAGIILMIVKVSNVFKQHLIARKIDVAGQFATYLSTSPDAEMQIALKSRKQALDFKLTNNELAGNCHSDDVKGLIANIQSDSPLPLASKKKKALNRPAIDPGLSKLIIWYLSCAAFWLVIGTTVGEYVGIKFVAPDADHISWLSFGRLRPVHTNMVFWGWASLGMLGLGYYIVPRVSNTPLASIKSGWYALLFINLSVIAGTICLMAGINNGGGEYREYIWPVALLFAIGMIITLVNFLKTIAKRTTKEIYISNWYMISAIIFAIVITVIAYVPTWQDGLGETIIQGYYMHQGVGMWFMLFTLGIVYYLLPQQLNKPIYSYSLGILAFWAQIIFYTLIGTHHFIFSSIPWWLQTVAIVGSVGMIIPVAAGTTNFIMTFKGAWYKVASSYTLPFFLVGIIFYFTGSMQGTAESFRSTNLIWHFTDFTVAHSHLTMYGIICFFLWAGIYAMVPRLTGKEAPQITVGAHFWLALIGLMFYTIPLMYGSTMKGLMAMQGKPFMEGVVFMQPYWLWRAIGGSLMWASHLFFAYNMYKMINTAPLGETDLDVVTSQKLLLETTI